MTKQVTFELIQKWADNYNIMPIIYNNQVFLIYFIILFICLL